jgi:hypothetical protein
MLPLAAVLHRVEPVRLLASQTALMCGSYSFRSGCATWGSRSPSSTRTSSVCTSSSARFLRSTFIVYHFVHACVHTKCPSLMCSRHERFH